MKNLGWIVEFDFKNFQPIEDEEIPLLENNTPVINTKIVAPISYQGGKQRIAGEILNNIPVKNTEMFYDLCCGSGAISTELVNRGHPVNNIFMLDQGPWGMFWKSIGNGSFDLNKFSDYINQIPKDTSLIQAWVKEVSKRPADQDAQYVFLILQACSFGGKAIWIEGNKWKNTSFRNQWIPTATSNRRSNVNPMMPMPQTLFERIKIICEKMKGVKGHHGDIREVRPTSGVVYIDPPYQGTTLYGHDFDIIEYAKSLPVKCYVSEGKALSENAQLISGGRAKGGISGERKSKPNEEWLSVFN